jgi:hypothetical protein
MGSTGKSGISTQSAVVVPAHRGVFSRHFANDQSRAASDDAVNELLMLVGAEVATSGGHAIRALTSRRTNSWPGSGTARTRARHRVAHAQTQRGAV